MSRSSRRFALTAVVTVAIFALAIAFGPLMPLTSGEVVMDIVRGVELGWSRTPAIAIGIASALSVPFLARLTPSVHALLVPDRRAAQVDARRAHMLAQPSRSFLTKAWLEGDDIANHRIDLTREIVRIGTGIDADLRLPGADEGSVHALVRRTPEGDFVLLDMSGSEKSPLTVNGQPLATAALRDGDRIGVGATSIVFRRG